MSIESQSDVVRTWFRLNPGEPMPMVNASTKPGGYLPLPDIETMRAEVESMSDKKVAADAIKVLYPGMTMPYRAGDSGAWCVRVSCDTYTYEKPVSSMDPHMREAFEKLIPEGE